jgi:MFS family permease
MAGGGALFGFCGFLFLSGALIGAIAYGLASWRWALLIVGVGYALIGLLLLIPVAHGMKSGLFRFDNTQRRLKEDTQYVKSKLAA